MTASIGMDEDAVSVSFASTVADFDLDRAVHDLHELREVRAALAMWEGELTEWIADAIGRNTITVEGVGAVCVKRGADRKGWDRRDLLRAVLDSRRKPSEDGEAHESDDGRAEVDKELVTCSPDLSRVLDVWNLGAPRVTVLRERGIDPDQYCEVTPGKLSVVIE